MPQHPIPDRFTTKTAEIRAKMLAASRAHAQRWAAAQLPPRPPKTRQKGNQAFVRLFKEGADQ